VGAVSSEKFEGKFDHLAIVVEDLEKSVGFYTDFLGFTKVSEVEDKPAGLHVVFVRRDPLTIELIKPSDGRKIGLNHIAFAVDDMDAELAKVQKRGCEITSPKRVNPKGWELAFFKDEEGVLMQLIKR
jgi:glyoxylase I family protein